VAPIDELSWREAEEVPVELTAVVEKAQAGDVAAFTTLLRLAARASEGPLEVLDVERGLVLEQAVQRAALVDRLLVLRVAHAPEGPERLQVVQAGRVASKLWLLTEEGKPHK